MRLCTCVTCEPHRSDLPATNAWAHAPLMHHIERNEKDSGATYGQAARMYGYPTAERRPSAGPLPAGPLPTPTPRLVHFVHLHLAASHVQQLQQVPPSRVCVYVCAPHRPRPCLDRAHVCLLRALSVPCPCLVHASVPHSVAWPWPLCARDEHMNIAFSYPYTIIK